MRRFGEKKEEFYFSWRPACAEVTAGVEDASVRSASPRETSFSDFVVWPVLPRGSRPRGFCGGLGRNRRF